MFELLQGRSVGVSGQGFYPKGPPDWPKAQKCFRGSVGARSYGDVPCNVRSLQEIKHASPILYATTIRYYGIAPESQWRA